MKCPECTVVLVQKENEPNTYNCMACNCTWRINKVFDLANIEEEDWDKLSPLFNNKRGVGT